MLFKLKPSVHITKGKYRDLLCEVQMQYLSFVPKSLTRFLNENNGKIDSDTLEAKYKKSEFYDIYLEYMEYLKGNKLLLFTSEITSVQKIRFEYVEKSTFNNMAISGFRSLSLYPYQRHHHLFHVCQSSHRRTDHLRYFGSDTVHRRPAQCPF